MQLRRDEPSRASSPARLAAGPGVGARAEVRHGL